MFHHINSMTMLSLVTLVAFIGATEPATAAGHKEIVAYRLINAKSMHIDQQAAAQQYKNALDNLGCETSLGSHGGHFDLTYRCPNWQSAQFVDHQTAHKWQAWLQGLGFEVAHRHD